MIAGRPARARNPATRRRAATLGLVALSLVACGKEADPVAHAIQSVKDRSLPPGDRLIPLEGPVREEYAIRASWEVETDMEWSAYAAWLSGQLSEYEARPDVGDTMRLSRPLEGDVFTVTFRPKARDGGLRVELVFEARPF